MCSQNIYPLSIKSDTKSRETNARTDLTPDSNTKKSPDSITVAGNKMLGTTC